MINYGETLLRNELNVLLTRGVNGLYVYAGWWRTSTSFKMRQNKMLLISQIFSNDRSRGTFPYFYRKGAGMQKRHAHVSPTLDIMAKKIFSLPEVTAAFIRDILELDVADAQIVEGSQPHSMAYEEGWLVLHCGGCGEPSPWRDREVIIEIQIRKQQYFESIPLLFGKSAGGECAKCASKARHIRCTSRWSPSMGLRILEKSLLLDEEAAINKYWLTNSRSGKQLKAYYKMASTKIFCRLPFRARQV